MSTRLILGLAAAQGMLNSAMVGYGVGSSRNPPPAPVVIVEAAKEAPEAKAEPEEKVALAHANVSGKEADPRAPAEIWNALKDGNERFTGNHEAHRHSEERRHDTATAQHPGAMVLTCADSRLSPELLFDQDVGDLFVVRVAGNVAEPVGMGSLEYGAEHLGSKVLVVLGHERCGAVTAALGDEVPSSPNLRALVDEITPALKDMDGTGASPQRVHDGVEANVKATAAELLASSEVLREKVEHGELIIVPAIYNLDTGAVRTLEAVTATTVARADEHGKGDEHGKADDKGDGKHAEKDDAKHDDKAKEGHGEKLAVHAR